MSFRLLDVFTGQLTEHSLSSPPPYLAASHAWSECFFAPNVHFLNSPGRASIVATLKQRYPSINHCWVDTICIDQKDEDDKLRQIPLMGKIFGKAKAVLIILGCKLGMQQDEVDSLTEKLEGAISMEAEEAWATEGHYWQSGEGRSLIAQAMRGLARLTTTHWSTRVWTLQEYILACTVVWIGTDCVSLTVRDDLFSALPSICDALVIDECIGGEFERLYSFFSGMANSRMRRIERTRVMELLGNRKATVECDEVYGVMAASEVEISTIKGESKEQAWARWVEAALSEGHLRWLLMPIARETVAMGTQSSRGNCILPPFSVRHKLSSGSGLDKVDPLGPLSIRNGAAIVTGRYIGSCHIETRLGTVHEPAPNRIHRDITIILFASGRWKQALRVVSAFGGGRYSSRQVILIARALMDNGPRAMRAVSRGNENNFRMKLKTEGQEAIWQDFMAFQMGQMPGMNEGVAYLVTIRRPPVVLDAIIVLAPGQPIPPGELVVVDVGGRTVDNRCVFLIATKGAGAGSKDFNTVMHKVAVTLPVSSDYDDAIKSLSLETFTLGGRDCQICGDLPTTNSQDNSVSIIPTMDTTSKKNLMRYSSIVKRRRLKNRCLHSSRPRSITSDRHRQLRSLRVHVKGRN